MSDSGDEDVIFEGSPLYDTLVSSGSLVQDLNIESLDRDVADRGLEHQLPSVSTYKTGLEPRVVSWRQRVKHFYLTLLAWVGVLTIEDLVKKKDVEIVTALLESSTLDEDDSDFLHSYLDIPRVPPEPGLVKRGAGILFVLVMPVVSAYGYLAVSRLEPDWRFVLLTTILTALTVATLPLIVLFWLHCYSGISCSKHLTDEEAAVKKYIQADEGFHGGLKKCLRLIQEAELIARGFTLVSQKSPVSRLEAGSSVSSGTRQCPGLRRLVFTLARNGIYSTRELTKQLLSLKSAGQVGEMKSSYLAFEPVQSYGPCLQLEHDGESSELYSITDGFSVSALKGICHLLQLHQSEFTKALALSYSNNFKYQGPEYDKVLELLDPASERLQAWTETVLESHNLHSCSLLSRKPSKKLMKPVSAVEEVYTAVHSLDLHLQSALTRVRTFSMWLEGKAGDTGDDCSYHGDDLVNNVMQPIRAELDSCQSCWEESLTRLERLLGKHKPEENSESGPKKLGETDELQDSSVGQAKNIEDYIIVDQVFEAYTDPSEAYHEDGDWDRSLTAEEKEKKKREKKEALRMLTELKSVISVRAVDWEKRERAALLRAHPELLLNQSAEQQEPTHDQSAADQNQTLNQSAANQEEALDQSAAQSEHQSAANQEEALDQSAAQSEHFLNQSTTQTGKTEGSEKNKSIDGNLTCVENVEDTRAKTIESDKVCTKKDDDNVTDDESGTDDDDSVTERKPLKSYVTFQGVRRLRQSNMLDLTDSDSEVDEVSKGCKTSEGIDKDKADENSEEQETDLYKPVQRCGLQQLPLFNFKTQGVIGDATDSDDEQERKDNVEDYVAKPALTLEERLRQLSGANLDMSSSLAAQVAARSRLMGGMTEATFGGEVFGEHSSSEEENGS